MKKLTATFAAVIFMATFLPTVSATDICSAEPLTVRNFNAEITSAVHLRTVSCMQESEVITTLSGGEIVKVIGTTEGWHKVRRTDGTEGWIWESFLTPTDKPFNLDTSGPEPEPVTYEPMRDITGHKYEDAIWFVYNNGIVEGYEDGSYKPDKNINRAELLKIVVESKYDNEFEAYQSVNCFSDVFADQWYAKYVCFGQDADIVEGYNDGTFRPAKNINFVEALKIVMIGMGYEYIEGDPWFRPIVELASENNFIPLDMDKFDDKLTRGQMAEMITRVMKYQSGELDEYLGEMSEARITYEMLEY